MCEGEATHAEMTLKFLKSVSGKMIAVKAISCIEPYNGGWGHVVWYHNGEEWVWVSPAEVSAYFEFIDEIFE